MKGLKSKVIYHGGSLPVPTYFQKGKIEIKEGAFHFYTKGESLKYPIDINIPIANIKSVVAEEKKYYSSVGYFLIVRYIDTKGKEENLELEIRSFGRRGRAQAISQLWAETLAKT